MTGDAILKERFLARGCFVLDCAGRAQRRRRFRSSVSMRMFGNLPVKRCRALLATAVQNGCLVFEVHGQKQWPIGANFRPENEEVADDELCDFGKASHDFEPFCFGLRRQSTAATALSESGEYANVREPSCKAVSRFACHRSPKWLPGFRGSRTKTVADYDRFRTRKREAD